MGLAWILYVCFMELILGLRMVDGRKEFNCNITNEFSRSTPFALQVVCFECKCSERMASA